MAHPTQTGVVDEVAAELGDEGLPEGVKGVRNPSMHRRASCTKMAETDGSCRVAGRRGDLLKGAVRVPPPTGSLIWGLCEPWYPTAQ
jgi:hypothetical protein